ncbi:hypothetical protein [Streptosporangium longisporum]
MLNAPTRDIGSLDLNYGLWLGEWFETIPDLQWPRTVETYSRMRYDPQLTGVLAAWTLPIRRATWAVDPSGCRDEVVQVVADDLGLPILGADNKPGPARRRGVRWSEHLRLAMLSLTFGHMVFERRYEIRGGQARLVNLGERMPHTIGDINLNPDGTVASISQHTAASQPIPAERLVWYVHEREGSNWAGRSIMRAAYGAWLLKHELWRVHATSNRRFGMGIPAVEAPAGATPAQIAEAQRLASAMRAGDQSGVGLPPGFKISLSGMTGSAPDTLAFISYLDQQMSRQALAGLMDLGQTPNGSRALGQAFLDLFMLALQATANEMAEMATSGHAGMPGIVTHLVDTNWGQDEPAPRIVASDVGTQHEVTAEALQMLMAAGAISPDPELEAYVRQTLRLPERAEELPPPAPAAASAKTTPAPPEVDPEENPEAEPETAQEAAQRRLTRSSARPRKGRAATGQRQMTLDEAESGVDPDAVQSLWERALEALLAAWKSISQAWRDKLAELVRAAVDGRNLPALAHMHLDSEEAEQVLNEALVALAEASAQQMAAEAAAQQVPVEPPPVDEGHLGAIAAALAALLAVWLAGAAAREALRLAVPGADGSDVADAVTDHLESLSDGFLREQFGGALSTAQMTGRFAVLDAAPAARYQALEILDRNTCPACAEIDGTVFDDLDAAKAVYGTGGYIDCHGRQRCRGLVIATWRGTL